MDEIREIEKILDLAILANGGEKHRKEWCQCDSSVGYVPCEYCAIFNGLTQAKSYFSNLRKRILNKFDEITEIESRLKLADEQDGHLDRKDCWKLVERVKELEKENYHLNNVLLEQSDGYFLQYRKRAEQAESRIKEYGADRHRLACEMSILREEHHDDCSRISTLEESIVDWKKSWELELAHSKQAESRIKELQFDFNEMVNVASEQTEAWRKEHKIAEQAETRIKVLTEAIEKHRQDKGIWEMPIHTLDKALYKVLEGK